jgi:hypothetical protein
MRTSNEDFKSLIEPGQICTAIRFWNLKTLPPQKRSGPESNNAFHPKAGKAH